MCWALPPYIGQSAKLLHEHDFTDFELLTTPRALPGAPELESAAKAVHAVPAERVWSNPDCGLKTRRYTEVEPALRHMVAATRRVRAEL